MTDFIKNQGGVLEWSLHAGQVQALGSQARTVVVLAGTQSGKTSFGPLWFLLEIQRMGQGDYIVATPTFPLLELKLLPEFKRLFEKQLKLGTYVGNPTKKFTFSDSGAKRMFGNNFKPDIPTQVFLVMPKTQTASSLPRQKPLGLMRLDRKNLRLVLNKPLTVGCPSIKAGH